jgi:uncharacterized membrane protein
MQLTPLIAVHMSAALAALAIGPVALWARRARVQHPRIHRAFGYAWVTLMLATAFTALFIRDFRLPNLAGYTPIHAMVPLTVLCLVLAFRALARRDVAAHQHWMKRLYIGGCLVAGSLTLLPGRHLHGVLFG